MITHVMIPTLCPIPIFYNSLQQPEIHIHMQMVFEKSFQITEVLKWS